MPESIPENPPTSRRSSWPRVVAGLGILTLLLGTGIWVIQDFTKFPGAALDKSLALVKGLGSEAATVARAFREGTVRTEFLSHATSLGGTMKLQVATLTHNETFLRSEQNTVAWGMIPLPKVVVQAQAPVEYTYYVDLSAPWEFRKEGNVVTVLPPPLGANTPAMDTSALTFYTLEGSIWQDEMKVRDRLQKTLTAALIKRARENEKVVRETGRKKIEEFVEQWLKEKFDDGQEIRVKVLFPDEVPVGDVEKPGMAPR